MPTDYSRYGIKFSSYEVKPVTLRELMRRWVWWVLRKTIGRLAR